jgi:copper chaperone CopZ
MQTMTLDAPALYGDHHVSEVRRILLELPGVQDVYVSSAFRVIEVTFEPDEVKAERINEVLDAAGYLGELPNVAESGQAATRSSENGHFRYTAVYESLKSTVSFAQKIGFEGRPLWPCPGMGPVITMDEE